MDSRIVGFSVFLLGYSLCASCARATVGETSQQATVATEPSGPKPSAAVQRMLVEASRLAEAKQPLDSLKKADQALELTRQTNDATGAALAEGARANALRDLQRTEEAVTAWQEAAHIWAGVGDAAAQITALVQAGLLCVPDKKSEAEKFFAQGLSIGKSENQRLGAVAQALHDSGIALGERKQEQTAMDYLATALAIRFKETPESLKLVETLNALANLATVRAAAGDDAQRQYSLARDYSAQAVEIGQRVAPDSSLTADSLRLLGHSERSLSSPGAARDHDLAALRIQRNLTLGGSVEEARILTEVGNLEEEQTNFDAAHQYIDEAVAIEERLAPGSRQLEGSLEDLAIVEVDEGDLLAARDHLQRALDFGEKQHASLGPIFINLGGVALAQNDFASARDYFEKALALFTKTAPHDPGVVFALGNLMETYHRQETSRPHSNVAGGLLPSSTKTNRWVWLLRNS